MRKRACVWLLLVMLCVLSVTTATGKQIELKVAMWISPGPEVEKTQEILNTYMAANPGVKLELIHQGYWQYHEKLMTLAAGGAAPDVMVVQRTYVPSFAETGIIRPVDQWLSREGIDLQRDVTEMASGTWNGKIYGIPIWGGPLVLAYNTDMFSVLGLPLPSDLSKRNDWTWNRLTDMGKKITRDTNGDGIRDVFAMPAPFYWEAVWYTYIRSFGGEVIRNNKAVIDSSEAAHGLQLFADIRWAHHIAPQPGEPAGNFLAATQALTHAWIADSPLLAQRIGNAFKADLISMPTGPAGSFHTASGCPVAVSSSSPYPEEAYKFALWFAMYSDEWKLRGIPSSMKITKREYRDYLAQFFASPDVLITALLGPTAIEPSVHTKITELQAAWTPIINNLADGNISGAEAAAQMGRLTNVVLGVK